MFREWLRRFGVVVLVVVPPSSAMLIWPDSQAAHLFSVGVLCVSMGVVIGSLYFRWRLRNQQNPVRISKNETVFLGLQGSDKGVLISAPRYGGLTQSWVSVGNQPPRR